MIFTWIIASICFIVLLYLYLVFPHKYVVGFYDSFMGFTDPNYPKRSLKEWQQKSSNFLYFQTIIPNSSGRKGTALNILSDRKDERILPILKDIIKKDDPDLNYIATLCLIKYGKEEAIPILMEVVNEYKNKRFYPDRVGQRSPYHRYFDALDALAKLKYEPAYPIILDHAKNGTNLEKQTVFNGFLYQYNNHWQEILPLYKDALLSKDLTISAETLKKLGRPEAIPILEEYAQAKPIHKERAEEAIKYLELLKENPK